MKPTVEAAEPPAAAQRIRRDTTVHIDSIRRYRSGCTTGYRAVDTSYGTYATFIDSVRETLHHRMIPNVPGPLTFTIGGALPCRWGRFRSGGPHGSFRAGFLFLSPGGEAWIVRGHVQRGSRGSGLRDEAFSCSHGRRSSMEEEIRIWERASAVRKPPRTITSSCAER